MKISDKRAEIIQAALESIAERGFHGAPMTDIAARAGVSIGTIYRYFESKDLLIMELYRELEDKVAAFLLEGYPAERPLREKFLCLLRGVLRYFIEHPLHYRYMEQYFNSPYGISLHRGGILDKSGNREILMDIFEQGIEQQILKALPRGVLFSLTFGPIIILMRDHILGFVVLDASLIEQITEACWDAIKK